MDYKPLDFLNFEIRFLTLLRPDEADEGIVACTLDHAFLHDQPEYDALSYCWGDATITAPVKVNGCIVKVTTNLEAGLRQLRHKGVKAVWVDALCINQQDPIERGLQVMRMGLIYSKAYQVIVWLGIEADNSSAAFSQLHSGQLSPEEVGKNPIRALLRRPYWNRVWIIQEISKGRHVQVSCGNSAIDWGTLAWALGKIRFLLPLEVSSLLDFRTEQHENPRSQMSLLEALSKSKHCVSSDKRDKIYALLNITSDGAEIVPTPNYKLAPDTVFFRAMKEIIAINPRFRYLVRPVAKVATIDPPWQPPLWSDVDIGISAWILQVIKRDALQNVTAQDTVDRPELTPPPSLPWDAKLFIDGEDMTERYWKLRPIVSENGLQAFGCILDEIQSTKYDRDRVSSEGLTFKQPLQPSWGPALDQLISNVLKELWAALISANFLSRTPHEHLVEFDQTRAAYALSTLFMGLIGRQKPDCVENLPHLSSFLASLLYAEGPVYLGKPVREWLQLYTHTEAYKGGFRTSKGLKVLGKWITLKGVNASVSEDQHAFLQSLDYTQDANLQLAIGKRSFLGLVPEQTRSGDVVARILQAAVPVILRPTPHNAGYTFIGEAYSQDFGPNGPAQVNPTEWNNYGMIPPGEKDKWHTMFIR